MTPIDLEKRIAGIPLGYSEVKYQGKKYGMNRTDFANGKTTKVYAEELGGNNYISFNYYRTQNGGLLKTCEMPRQKILDFLGGMRPESAPIIFSPQSSETR